MMQNSLGVQDSIILGMPVIQVNSDSVTEQFVAQELLACSDPYIESELFSGQERPGGAVRKLIISLVLKEWFFLLR